MKRTGGGGMGYIMALVVLVIVLYLSAKAWGTAMPKAQGALIPGIPVKVDDHGTGAGEALRQGGLPNMQQMGLNTDQHIQQIQDATKKQD
ncbi:MAG TPA: hypothetical protein VGQ67_05685 [Candidatus Polarisedimenticolia bacterium]|nr:hypothetical protein [Candidatus Polarisedimenticolia bacterium]